MKTVRLCEESDFFVISGWESTSIENQSGLVDNLRNFKGNPAIMRRNMQAALPVVQPRQLAIEKGEKGVLDLFFLNETNKNIQDTLQIEILDPVGELVFSREYPFSDTLPDNFVNLLARNVETPVLDEPGFYCLHSSLKGQPKISAKDSILVVSLDDNLPGATEVKVGVLTDIAPFVSGIDNLPGVLAGSYDPAKEYDFIICSQKTDGDSKEVRTLIKELVQANSQGTPLLFVPPKASDAQFYGHLLDSLGVFDVQGFVGRTRRPWLGSWIFVKEHPVLEGLPANQAMKTYYQVATREFWNGQDLQENAGLILEGMGIEVFAGYGRDHEPAVGATGFFVENGKGTMGFYGFSGILYGIGHGSGMQPVVAKKILLNTIHHLNK
jgi:hypothetical protein